MYRLLTTVIILASRFIVAESDDSATDGARDAPQRIILAHGVLMAALFAIFFPIGAIILRMSRFRNAVRLHGGWQIISYTGALAGFGIGAWMATIEKKWTTSNGHPIIGTIVVGLLLFQPFGGIIHHRLYVKRGTSTPIGTGHKWAGRLLLVLGLINGGLGLQLSNEDKNFIIPYSIVGGLLYLVWFGFAVRKEKGGIRKPSTNTSSTV